MKNKNISNLAKKTQLSEEEKMETDLMAQEFVDALNKAALESEERDQRWNVIWAIEETKWPYGLGGLSRKEVPDNLQEIFDKCIGRSQIIAREACQTEESLNKYLDENVKKRT